MAILGAAALGEAFKKHPDNLAAAFQEYNESFGPVVKGIQAQAVEFWVETAIPGSEEAIQKRNEHFGLAACS